MAAGALILSSSNRLAVTTTSFKVPCGTCAKPDKQTAESQPSAAQRRRVRNTFLMMNTQQKPSPPSPTVLGRSAVRQAHVHLVGRYPGLRKQPLSAFPVACSRRPVAMWDRAKPREQFVRLTVAGAAQADLGRTLGNLYQSRFGLLLPVELRRVNHTASTNKIILGVKSPVALK